MCSKEIPDHLQTKDKEVIEIFEDNELFYRRFNVVDPPEEWEAKSLSSNVFPLDDDSYNRSKFSSPEEVLLDEDSILAAKDISHWGILSIAHKDVVGQYFILVDNKTERKFQILPKHTPKECMYPHCDFVIFDSSTKEPPPKKPKSIKSAIRLHLMEVKDVIRKYTTV